MRPPKGEFNIGSEDDWHYPNRGYQPDGDNYTCTVSASSVAGECTRWDDTNSGWTAEDIELYRYPYVASMKDGIRIVKTTPMVTKTADPVVILPGDEVEYTVLFSGNTPSPLDGFSIGDYELKDFLPQGTTYVEDSTEWLSAADAKDAYEDDPEEVAFGAVNLGEPDEGVEDGKGTLSWATAEVDGMEQNVVYGVKYKLKFSKDSQPDVAYENTVTASYSGATDQDTASVVMAESGKTSIVKTTETDVAPLHSGCSAEETTKPKWTVTVLSDHSVHQDWVDVIDVLPYEGDARGTDIKGAGATYTTKVANAGDGTVYYTTDDVNDDPGSEQNGSAGSPSNIWIQKSDGKIPPDAKAVRVVYEDGLAPRRQVSFDLEVDAKNFKRGTTLFNRAQGRAETTRLVMRTSSPMSFDSGEATWGKVDETDHYLEGSEWTLTPVTAQGGTTCDDIEPLDVKDCVGEDVAACEGMFDQDPEPGKFKVEGLGLGWYELVETKSPAGYVLDTDPRYAEVKVEEEDCGGPEPGLVWTPADFGKVTNTPQEVPKIPMTGGVSILAFMLIAGGAGTFAAGSQMWKRRKSH